MPLALQPKYNKAENYKVKAYATLKKRLIRFLKAILSMRLGVVVLLYRITVDYFVHVLGMLESCKFMCIYVNSTSLAYTVPYYIEEIFYIKLNFYKLRETFNISKNDLIAIFILKFKN